MIDVRIVLLLTVSFQQFIPIALVTLESDDHSGHANLDVPDSGGASRSAPNLLEAMEVSSDEEHEAGEARGRATSSRTIPILRLDYRATRDEEDDFSDNEDERSQFEKSRSSSPYPIHSGDENAGLSRSNSPLLGLGGISLASHSRSPSPGLPEHLLSLRPPSPLAGPNNQISAHGHTVETDEKRNTECKFPCLCFFQYISLL